MLAKKMLVSWVVLAAASALQLDQVSTQSQASQQLSSLLSNLGLGNMLSSGASQDGTLTAGVDFFGLRANAGVNPLGQAQASAGVPGLGTSAQTGSSGRRLRAT